MCLIPFMYLFTASNIKHFIIFSQPLVSCDKENNGIRNCSESKLEVISWVYLYCNTKSKDQFHIARKACGHEQYLHKNFDIKIQINKIKKKSYDNSSDFFTH